MRNVHVVVLCSALALACGAPPVSTDAGPVQNPDASCWAGCSPATCVGGVASCSPGFVPSACAAPLCAGGTALCRATPDAPALVILCVSGAR